MSDVVLDASALLALLNREPGADRVAEAIVSGAVMSTVNLSEVIAKLADVGMPEVEIREAVEPLGIEFVSLGGEAAVAIGLLRPATRSAGLSLGDRACLALGQRLGLAVVTADREWDQLEVPGLGEIEVIR